MEQTWRPPETTCWFPSQPRGWRLRMGQSSLAGGSVTPSEVNKFGPDPLRRGKGRLEAQRQLADLIVWETLCHKLTIYCDSLQ
jgi:hypothetical protein